MTPEPPRRSPFWGYSDLFLFVGLALPSLLVGALLVKAVFLIFRITVANRSSGSISARSLADRSDSTRSRGVPASSAAR